jgi:hypothetical protein
MSYLAIARGVVTGYERNEITPIQRRDEPVSGYERNEFVEKTPVLPPHDAEHLKAQIIEVVTVDPEHFDRTEYDALWADWSALQEVAP